ncbi:hypothetical protein HaLaN_20478 [Haematococcus lacustris]|uniref:Uncharacterized protein n=1 Tax=Haematococcus lacustris TaxID=44745 RepID=A0A699ZTC7_HAELA|nr:hypothetical protein HaLaN_20478 [Haematococcus lacustris]
MLRGDAPVTRNITIDLSNLPNNPGRVDVNTGYCSTASCTSADLCTALDKLG